MEVYISAASLIQVELGLLSNTSVASYYMHSPSLKMVDALLTLLVVYVNLLYCYQQNDDLEQMRLALDEANYLVENFLAGSLEARRLVARPNEVWGKLYHEKYLALKGFKHLLVQEYQSRWGTGQPVNLDEIEILDRAEKDVRAKAVMKKEIMQHLFEKHFVDSESPAWVNGRDPLGKPIIELSKSNQVN